MLRLLLVTVMAMLFLGLSSHEAEAFPPDVQKIYDAAKVDLKEQRSFQALEKFQQCLEMVRGDNESTWNLLMAVSLTYEQMGQLDHAVEYYRRFLKETEERATTLEEKWQMRREKVVSNIRQHEKEILELRGLVDIRSNPPGAEIRVDGRAIGADGVAKAPFITYLKPGQRSVELTLPGYLKFEKVVDVTVDSRQRVDYKLVKAKKAVAAGSKTKGKKVKKRRPKKGKKKAAAATTKKDADSGGPGLWPWVTVGSGVGLLGAGFMFQGKAQSAADEIDSNAAACAPNCTAADDAGYDDLKADIDSNNMLAVSMYALGTLAIAGGTYLFLSGDEGGKTKKASADQGSLPLVVIAPFDDGAYVQTGWSW